MAWLKIGVSVKLKCKFQNSMNKVSNWKNNNKIQKKRENKTYENRWNPCGCIYIYIYCKI